MDNQPEVVQLDIDTHPEREQDSSLYRKGEILFAIITLLILQYTYSSENPYLIPEKIDTNSIKTEDSELYFFSHNQAKITFQNTRE